MGKVPAQPTLYLHGARDGCIDVTMAEATRSVLSTGSDVVIAEGAGHFLHLEKPAEVNQRIVGFLAALRRAAGLIAFTIRGPRVRPSGELRQRRRYYVLGAVSFRVHVPCVPCQKVTPGPGRSGGTGVVGCRRGPDQRAGTASTASASA